MKTNLMNQNSIKYKKELIFIFLIFKVIFIYAQIKHVKIAHINNNYYMLIKHDTIPKDSLTFFFIEDSNNKNFKIKQLKFNDTNFSDIKYVKQFYPREDYYYSKYFYMFKLDKLDVLKDNKIEIKFDELNFINSFISNEDLENINYIYFLMHNSSSTLYIMLSEYKLCSIF